MIAAWIVLAEHIGYSTYAIYAHTHAAKRSQMQIDMTNMTTNMLTLAFPFASRETDQFVLHTLSSAIHTSCAVTMALLVSAGGEAVSAKGP